MGLGNALNAPAWQATTPDLVPREELAAAVALGGISVNVARAVGPALGGLLVAALGPGWVFLLNAASFLGVVVVLARWQHEVPRSRLPPEDVPGAMRAGVRYVRHSAPFRAVLARTAAFVVPASALWALLPLFARRGLGLSATGYGLLLGCLGAGAIVGAAFLPRLRERLTSDRLVLAGTAVFAAVSAVVALARVPLIAGGGLFIGGMAWMGAMSTLSVAAQNAVPAWVRARALAVGLLAVQGSMALGSLLWGVVATHSDIPTALVAGAAMLLAGAVASRRFVLHGLSNLDLRPDPRWSLPETACQLDGDEGPVLVTLEYGVDPDQAAEFLRAVRRPDAVRLRVIRRPAAGRTPVPRASPRRTSPRSRSSSPTRGGRSATGRGRDRRRGGLPVAGAGASRGRRRRRASRRDAAPHDRSSPRARAGAPGRRETRGRPPPRRAGRRRRRRWSS